MKKDKHKDAINFLFTTVLAQVVISGYAQMLMGKSKTLKKTLLYN